MAHAEMTDGQIEALARHLFGSEARIRQARILKALPGYRVMAIRLERPRLTMTLKLAGEGAPRAAEFERTAALYRQVRQAGGVPVPQVFGVDSSCSAFTWRYLALEHIPGAAWSSLRRRLEDDERDQALRQLGQAVAALHAITFPAFGALGADLSVSNPLPLVDALRKHAGRIITQPGLLDLFLDALDRNAGRFDDPGPASLVHEDLHGGNLLFARDSGGWRLAAMLDFDKAWAGPAESDLARIAFWGGSAGGMADAAFWAAYTERHPLRPGFDERRPLYQLLWCLEYAQPTRRHRADTLRLCRWLGVFAPRPLFA